LREVERERAKGREKGLEEESLKFKNGVEIQEAKVRLRLGLCSIEVRGIVFYHNL